MASLKRAIRYQMIEAKNFLLGFWGTMVVVNILFYILNNSLSHRSSVGFSLGVSEGPTLISVAGINLMAMFISVIAYNYERNYEGFPLSISLSVTRKDYFISFLANNIIIAFISAIIQGGLLKIDPIFIKMIGRKPLYEFINFNLQTDNIFFIIFSLFVLFLSFICFWNLLSSINYKFGYKMWIVILGGNIALSILNIKILEKFLERIFLFIGDVLITRYGVFEVLVISIIIVIIYTLNYFITINSDIKRSSI